MNLYDVNDQVMSGVISGMKAASDRFGERMQDIHDENVERKLSKYWHDYAFNLAHQVDDLTRLLHKQNAVIAENVISLRKETARVEKYRSLSVSHAAYLDLLIKRLVKVEDLFQRQSANTFALNEFRKLALAALEKIQDPEHSKLTDPDQRHLMLNEAWEEFMKTTNVKRGIPQLGIDKP